MSGIAAFSVELQFQLRATQRKRKAAEKMRAWRAAQSAEDKERRRIARQENRRVEDERIARRQRFTRLSASEQEEIRARDRNRHKRLRAIKVKLREAKEIRDADDREEIARAIAAGEAAADAASSSSSDADETVKKKRGKVSKEVELSTVFMRASIDDRSDLFGPRPTVPLTKRARLRSYVDSVRAHVHALKSNQCTYACTRAQRLVEFLCTY